MRIRLFSSKTCKPIWWTLTAALSVALFADTPLRAEPDPRLSTGSTAVAQWVGYLLVSDSDSLELVIDIDRHSDGRWLCEIDVPDAGFVDVVYSCFVQNGAVTLRAESSQLLGRLSDDGRMLTGRLMQEGEKLVFAASRIGEPEISPATRQTAEETRAEQRFPENTVPIRIVRHGPAVAHIVEVVINDHGPYRFALDINNDVTLLSHSVIEGLELQRREGIVDDEDEPRVEIGALQIANVTLSRLEAIPFDFTRTFYASDPPDGMIGFSSLAGFLTAIDLAQSELTLARGELANEGSREILPYRLDNDNVPLVRATVAGHDVEAQMSIATRSPVSLSEAYMDSLDLLGDPARIGRMASEKGEFPILSSRFDGELMLGGHAVDLSSLQFSNIYDHADIGHSTLDEFVLTFDQKNRRVRIIRSDATSAALVTAAAVPNLSDGLPKLKTAFNADPDNVRMIVILSPT